PGILLNMVSMPSRRRASTSGRLSGSTVKTLTRVVTALSTRTVVSMVGLLVWLSAGKVARIPPTRLLAMRARRDSLVSIAGIGDPLLGRGLPDRPHRQIGALQHQDEPERPNGPVC